MSSIYIASINISEQNLILGWSKKEKNIRKFVEESLHNSDLIIISKASFDNIGELFDCPFNIDIKSIENDQIKKYSKRYLPLIEWEILNKEFDQFIYNMKERFSDLNIIQDALSEKGYSALQIVKQEIAQAEIRKLYISFLNHHRFFNNSGSIKDILERVMERKSFQESKDMDDEYRRIMGLNEYQYLQ